MNQMSQQMPNMNQVGAMMHPQMAMNPMMMYQMQGNMAQNFNMPQQNQQ